MSTNKILGIDIGGSGIKGAIVDVTTGELLSERKRIPTPQPATPDAVAETVAELTKSFDWKNGPIGCGFPAVVKKGMVYTASNIDKSWIGTNAKTIFQKATGCDVFIANDADVAGLAEMEHGIGKDVKGTVIMITIGTGLGSAFFFNGLLIPNSELGHLEMEGMVAEKYAAGSIRKKENLSDEEWGFRLNKYLLNIERFFSPDMIILGGGGSKHFEKLEDKFDIEADIGPAKFRNHAGIIGAAMYAATEISAKAKAKAV